jgi:hypothetical protein
LLNHLSYYLQTTNFLGKYKHLSKGLGCYFWACGSWEFLEGEDGVFTRKTYRNLVEFRNNGGSFESLLRTGASYGRWLFTTGDGRSVEGNNWAA